MPAPVARDKTLAPKHRDIIARTHPVCHWCGCELDFETKKPTPNKFVVDHVIPLSLGGEDVLANKVASCWRCNARKGDTYPENIIQRSGALKR